MRQGAVRTGDVPKLVVHIAHVEHDERDSREAQWDEEPREAATVLGQPTEEEDDVEDEELVVPQRDARRLCSQPYSRRHMGKETTNK